ncbi:NAD-glutamate dehydrogenase domain-containing protein [Nocardioides convexus]|uniref:NAD-glutamate dehydrogenase domain-containing protein n=1 Tax=Nocardioides convexus TaxID=2712224 RepID=UPI00241836E6|nr:NAD-glutamate dehydrogenase domain-containing protein [Nocardioides convexus]
MISKGGGVYPRSAKSIPISAEVRSALGIAGAVERITPAEPDAGDPAGAGRPAVERRYRHLRQGRLRDPRRGR